MAAARTRRSEPAPPARTPNLGSESGMRSSTCPSPVKAPSSSNAPRARKSFSDASTARIDGGSKARESSASAAATRGCRSPLRIDPNLTQT